MRDLLRIPYQCPKEVRPLWVEIYKQAAAYFKENNLKIVREELRENGIHFHIKHPVNGNVMSYRAKLDRLTKLEYIGTKKDTWRDAEVMKFKVKKESRLGELEAAIDKK
ncbi:hypothetical protein [Enterococcus termitis]|uniref:Uncharacterized protein n=1 Tax=Enterococcus termitis TaxID=332950 RepID=A0A1E5GU08_9ENTE|nr:hypothetical protein [Enterococcus termitis]OEG16155.1 hypothetical protein BCR25_18340 [Enterococcus termitis]